MTLDDGLLKQTQVAAAQFAEAERQALLARAEYHTAIRRLHLAGASLREVAQAVGISHQRVQQIVDEAGGTWWQRMWRTRKIKRDAVCTFCRRPPSEVAKLIAGPNVYVCDGCVVAAEQTIAGGARRGPLGLATKGARAVCSFCGKRHADGRPLVLADDAAVCGECLKLCRDFVDGRTG